MKKLILILVLLIVSIGVTSCTDDTISETETIYGIDPDDIETPGDKETP